MNVSGRRGRGRPPKPSPLDAWISTAAQGSDPSELNEMRQVEQQMAIAEEKFIGKYRGLGVTRSLALRYALIGEGIFDQATAAEITEKYKAKTKRVEEGRLEGARSTKEFAETRHAQVVEAGGDIVNAVVLDRMSIREAASILRMRGVDASDSTLRRVLRKLLSEYRSKVTG